MACRISAADSQSADAASCIAMGLAVAARTARTARGDPVPDIVI